MLPPLSRPGRLGVLVVANLLAATVCFGEPFVAGFERLAESGRMREAGEVLLSELGCIHCHRPDPAMGDRFPVYQAPNLGGLADRVSSEFVRSYLIDPQGAHPETRMPDMLAALSTSEKRSAVERLLRSLGMENPATAKPAAAPSAETVRAGQVLFHTIGCVACHAPDGDFSSDARHEHRRSGDGSTERGGLGHVREKYLPGALTAFLLDPLLHRPSGRMPRVPLTANEARQLEAYLTGRSVTSTEDAKAVQPARRDLQVLKTFRCVACHETDADPRGAQHSKPSKPLRDLDPRASGGCLGETPVSDVPRYELSAPQREALRKALSSPALVQSRSAAQRLEQRLFALNCFACHSRDDIGGPGAARRQYFTGNADDLGDEGQFPPPLTGIGAKLKPEALREILVGNGAVRPYMNTRMPGFGSDQASALTALFDLVDHRDSSDERPVVGRNALGRELVGDQGLNCITCHSLLGHPSLGIPAVDLATAPRRLRPQWFRDHLIDPVQHRANTRMPSFWPDGKSVHPAGGGSPIRQIDSIWVYLSESDQTRLPSGMENPRNFELIPTNRPVVFRTFMKDVGMHAIAVGLPGRLHAAFDSRDLRWALLWKGRFLDAESTWDDRFAALAEALGEDVIRLAPGPGFARLDSPEGDEWPDHADSRKFKGFRLDPQGYPRFIYELFGVVFTDWVQADGDFGLRRTIEWQPSSASVANLWFRAASGRTIRKEGEVYMIDETWKTRVNLRDGIVRASNGGMELLFPLPPRDRATSIVQEFEW